MIFDFFEHFFQFKVNESRTYDWVQTFVSDDHSENTVIKRKITLKVLKVESDGTATLERTSQLVSVIINGQTVSAEPDSDKTVTTEVHSKFGEVTARPFNPLFPLLMARQLRPLDVIFPVEEGQLEQEWTHSIWEPDLNLPKIDMKFHIQSRTKEAMKISMHFSETQGSGLMTGSGFSELDTKSGWLINQKIVMGPTIVPGDEEQIPVILTSEMTLK